VDRTTEAHGGRTPIELINFFRSPGGHSLFIKGEAGTGKTTMALQLIEELTDEPDYYLSARVSDEALYKQFPWLEAKAKKNNLLRAGKAFLNKTRTPVPRQLSDLQQEATLQVAKDLLRVLSKTEAMPTVVRSELQRLEGQIESGEVCREDDEPFQGEVSESSITLDLGIMLPELELGYDMVESNLPKKTFIVLDSIDALSERYGISASRITNTLQKDLVENSGTNITYVMESGERSGLDYLGDGVVRLVNEQRDGRRVRELIIEKLRGQRVEHWKYMFTLLGGRLRVFDNYWFKIPETLDRHPALKDPAPGLVSTGNEHMDAVVRGFPTSSVVLLEIGPDVSLEIIRAFELSLAANFLANGRGVVWFPLHSIDYAQLERQMRELVKKEAGGLRILDHEGSLDRSYPFVTVVEGSDAAQDLRWNSLKYMLTGANGPYLSILGFDTLESVYGKDVLPSTFGHMEAMRRGGHLVLAEATTASYSLRQLVHQSQMHIKLESFSGTVMMCGEKPHTPYYHLDFEQAKGKLRPPLIALV
jgi:KaiC/GvpD/RAD55 family RecA-like ATPase